MVGYLDTSGLKESLAALDRLARLDANKDLKREFTKLADAAISEAKSGARTRMERRAANTLASSSVSGNSSASSATAAVIRFGAGFEGAFGAEYGGQSGLRRVVSSFGFYTGWNQFKPWQGSGSSAGYFVWPGIRRAVEDNLDVMAEAIARNFSAGYVSPDGPVQGAAASAALFAGLDTQMSSARAARGA